MQFFFPTNKQVAFTRGSNKAICLLVPLSASMRLFSPACKMAFMIQPRYFLWNCLSCKIPYTWQMKIMFSIPNTPLSGYLGACLVVSHWDSDADWRSTSWAHTRLLTLGATRRSLTKLLNFWACGWGSQDKGESEPVSSSCIFTSFAFFFFFCIQFIPLGQGM